MFRISSIFLLASILTQDVVAQRDIDVIGFGGGLPSYATANQRPLNKTSVSFPGFNLDADPSSTIYASSSTNWTWNAGLSIVNTQTNESNYALSAASNATVNVIDVAYTLDFPNSPLPQQNYTNWTICANVLDVPWTSAVLGRAGSDTGDCSVVLGTACLNQFRRGWISGSGSSNNVGCTNGPSFSSLSECSGITTNGYGYGAASIMSHLSDPNNRSSPEIGLKSGQIFSYEASRSFNASDAVSYYNAYASQLRMMVMTFAPSKGYVANHTGVLNQGEVRTFCTILNKNAPRTNGAALSRVGGLMGIKGVGGMLALAWATVFVWGMV